MSSTGGCGVGGNAIYEKQKQQGLYGMHFWVLKETKNAELFFIKHSLSPSSSCRVCFHRKRHRQGLGIWTRICCLVERMKLLMRTYLEACATYCETNIEQKIFISAWNICSQVKYDIDKAALRQLDSSKTRGNTYLLVRSLEETVYGTA